VYLQASNLITALALRIRYEPFQSATQGCLKVDG
jgi:hypothetical protein